MKSIPDLSEFIDLSQRRAQRRVEHGYHALENDVTVAIYNTSKGYQTLTVRISDDLARRHGLVPGARMTCRVHPDQQHIALMPGNGGNGASLFRPKGGRSLVFQTSVKGGTLEPQKAAKATLGKIDGGVLVSLA